MAKKRKGELPSGNLRKLVFDHYEPLFNKDGTPILDSHGKQKQKRIYQSITASSAKELDLAVADFKANKRGKVKPCDLTLAEGIDDYIKNLDALLSPTTISGYNIIKENAFPGIMHMRMSAIDQTIFENAMNMEAKRPSSSRRCKGKPISIKTLRNEYGLVHTVLKKYTGKDFTAKIPEPEQHIKELPEPSEVFHAVKGTNIELAALLAMWLSFTASEIRGLTKSESVKDGYITIKQVIVNVNGKDITKKRAKQTTRIRKHRIPQYIQSLIDKTETDTLVPISTKMLNYYLSKHLRANDVPHISFHDLRHLNASVMSMLNIPDKYAQERGGWKTDKVMKKVYTHTFSQERVAADDKIDDYFYNNVIGDTPEKEEKYRAWLLLFEKSDSQNSKKEFEKFYDNMQHKMQHE